jgi:hypothetical protein
LKIHQQQQALLLQLQALVCQRRQAGQNTLASQQDKQQLQHTLTTKRSLLSSSCL